MQHEGFDDAALRAAQLVIDPYALEGLSTSPPAEGAVVSIRGEYHVPDEGEALRCCLCPQHTPHWNGFVIATDTGSQHLIGSTCGPKHLGITFRTAKNQHKDRLTRQGNLYRLDAVLAQFDAFLAQCNAVLFAPLFRSLQERLAQFETAAGDATVRLRSLVLRGAGLTENVTVRDFEAERRRDETASKDSEKKPIYRQEAQPIGPLAGRGFLNVEQLRATVFAFKSGLREFKQAVANGTGGIATNRLAKMLKELADAHERANIAVASINNARAFFSADNAERLQRWSHDGSVQDISAAPGGLSVRASGKAPVLIAAPEGDTIKAFTSFPSGT